MRARGAVYPEHLPARCATLRWSPQSGRCWRVNGVKRDRESWSEGGKGRKQHRVRPGHGWWLVFGRFGNLHCKLFLEIRRLIPHAAESGSEDKYMYVTRHIQTGTHQYLCFICFNDRPSQPAFMLCRLEREWSAKRPSKCPFCSCALPYLHMIERAIVQFLHSHLPLILPQPM